MATRTSDAGSATLDGALITPELESRPSRAPDYELQARALDELAGSAAEAPEAALQRLAEVLVQRCGFGSAGVSLLEAAGGARSFRFVAVAGVWAEQRGGTVPVEASPCRMAVDRDAVLLFKGTGCFLPTATAGPAFSELLLAPLRVGGQPVGAVWAAAHDAGRPFDREDMRLLLSLGRFAGVTLQLTASLAATSTARRELGRSADAHDAAMRWNALRSRQILDSAVDYAIIATDTGGLVTHWNEGARRVLGWTEAEMRGNGAERFFTPEDVAAGIIGQEMRQALASGQGNDERWHLRKCGERFWAAGEMTPLRDEAGRHIGFVKVLRDRTAQHEAQARLEATLRDQQDFARLALGSVGGVGVWTYDVAPDRFRFDAAIAELHGLSAADGEAGLGRARFLANVHPDDRAALAATLASGAITPGDLELEYRLVHPDGSVRWVLSRGHTYFEAGHAVRRVGVGVEVTRQRQLEEELRQSQKMEAIGQLTGGVAHDFNNLLTVIRSSVELLRRPGLPEARRDRYLGAVADTVDRASRLTGQLLTFARRQALTPETFDVGERLRGVADMLDTLVGARVQVQAELPQAPCAVRADPGQFETAFVNMVVNARDAMGGEGRLRVRVVCGVDMPPVRGQPGAPGPFAAVSISDTGSGIAPELIGRIFDPFFTTKAVGKGTGLGLSQVFGFAKQSGGDVDVRSVLGEGSTFTLYLPMEAAGGG